MNFKELNLSEGMQKTLADLGYTEATPIQEQAIPPALEGRDIIGQAQTGTGKTAGFSIPIIETIEANSTLQTLILVPTRELALQVSEAFTQMSKHSGIRVATVFGGASIEQQIRNLRQGFEVVVGTPGRVIDLMKRKVMKMNNIKFLVLDEVDEMLSMGFVEDIEHVVGQITQEHQTLFFSATMNNKIQNVAQKFLVDPVYIKIKASKENLKKIEQLYLVMKDSQKQQVIANLLRTQKPERAIIFARTKRRVDEITDALVHDGFVVDRIHGDLSQEQRTFTFKKFRNGLTPVVVATDVAARGLDIKELSHVYNYDLPQESEYYVHRIGRTGRADASGIAVSFFTAKELRSTLPLLERITGSTMRKIAHPTADEVVESVTKEAIAKLVANIENVTNEKYTLQAQELLATTDATELVASALMLLTPDFNEDKFRANHRDDDHTSFNDRGDGGRNRRSGGGGYQGNRNGGGRGGDRRRGGDNDRRGGSSDFRGGDRRRSGDNNDRRRGGDNDRRGGSSDFRGGDRRRSGDNNDRRGGNSDFRGGDRRRNDSTGNRNNRDWAAKRVSRDSNDSKPKFYDEKKKKKTTDRTTNK